MKYLLIALLFPVVCFSQQKKDSKIIVSISDTSNLFNRLSVALIEKGYLFENKDQQLGFISTGEKHISNTPGSLKIMAIIKDSTIVFSGLFALDIEQSIMGVKMERTFEPLLFTGPNKGTYKICWREMEGIAKQFGKISYSK